MTALGSFGNIGPEVVGVKSAERLASYAAPIGSEYLSGAIRDFNDKPVSGVRGSIGGKPLFDDVEDVPVAP
jgi:hypothetical protein